ncbi:MAG: NAD(P)H-binding protein [Solirubrobacterales bacterium]|nr:NAD(P)H-binding protein [Solirubrobacterales bacterium]
MRDPEPILLTGASGYVGSHLLDELLRRGRSVRALMREPAPGRLPAQVDARKGDAVAGTGLAEALDGCRTAYYLIHSMGSGSGDAAGFARRDREAAVNFGEAARDAGVERVIYLGGLGDETTSEHLRSRHEVGELLRQRVPGLVYVRAAMVIGAGSASFEMLRHLTRRLPVMITPRWLNTRSQPVAIVDVARALAALAELEEVPAEVQLGGADVLSYREMIGRTASVMGRRGPLVMPVPLLTPRLSSHWVALVTPVDIGLVRPLIDGLKEEMVVHTPPPPGVNDRPMGFDGAVREALA